MSATSGTSRVILVLSALWAFAAMAGYWIATTGDGDPESRGYLRMSFSMFGWPTLIVGGLLAMLSARAGYIHYQNGDRLSVPAAALVLSLTGIVFVLLI